MKILAIMSLLAMFGIAGNWDHEEEGHEAQEQAAQSVHEDRAIKKIDFSYISPCEWPDGTMTFEEFSVSDARSYSSDELDEFCRDIGAKGFPGN